MDSLKIKTVNKEFTCQECQNEITLDENVKVGDVIECPYCGIEYDVIEKTDNGEFLLQIIEEEK